MTTETRTLKADAREIRLHMSNLDHVIDEGFEDALRVEPNEVYGRHAAWNFNGLVWFDGEQFVEEVWVYGSPQQIFRAESLLRLMEIVNTQYGAE